MANKFVIDTLISLFQDEIKNEITYTDTEIVLTATNGSRIKISAT